MLRNLLSQSEEAADRGYLRTKSVAQERLEMQRLG
jgi:hypothetical protein